MAKPIELETVFTGESARVFNEYIESPVQHFSKESQTLIQEARLLSKEWP